MEQPMPLKIRHSPEAVLTPQPDVPWAQTMVLNPAIARDPTSSRLHMLFRATGPGEAHRQSNRPDPYPIYLGYAFSDDRGATWTADWSRPALAPKLSETPEQLLVTDARARKTVNYANGCIEDPRLTWLEGRLYLTAACRMFPPGPYWEHDDPLQCTPGWVRSADHSFGRAARENLTVNVLYEVHLDRLATGRYDEAFSYLGPLTDPERGDNRDAFLFPEKLVIDGKPRYVCAHRPRDPQHYPGGRPGQPPAIYLAAADRLEDLAGADARHILLATGVLSWEGNRVGGSFSPLRLDERRWLFPYHAKQNDEVGYTQSFMILEQDASGWPRLKHRCADRLIHASESWQQPAKFPVPCIFTCGGLVDEVGDLVMSYGAADEMVGIAWTHFDALVDYVSRFDATGRQ